MQERAIENAVGESMGKRPGLFLVDLQLNPNNQIIVVIDGDKSVSVDDCIAISREIEGKFDRETEDFSLKVTSAGVSTPLSLPRQYKKNIGRKLDVKTANERYKAELTNATDDAIELYWKQREPKPIGKGKHTVKKQVNLSYSEIKEAKVMITFN